MKILYFYLNKRYLSLYIYLNKMSTVQSIEIMNRERIGDLFPFDDSLFSSRKRKIWYGERYRSFCVAKLTFKQFYGCLDPFLLREKDRNVLSVIHEHYLSAITWEMDVLVRINRSAMMDDIKNTQHAADVRRKARNAQNIIYGTNRIKELDRSITPSFTKFYSGGEKKHERARKLRNLNMDSNEILYWSDRN